MACINLNPGRYSKRHSRKKKPYPSYNYSNPDTVEKLTAYMINPDKTCEEYINYYNVPTTTPEAVQDSFKAIQKLYGKEDGRHAEHFVISLNSTESEILGVEGIAKITKEYCAPFAEEYQVVSAVHLEKEKQLHFHVEINPVSFKTGKRLHKDGKFLHEQRAIVKTLVNKELQNLNPIDRH